MGEPRADISSFFDFSSDFAGKQEAEEIFAAVARSSIVAMKEREREKKGTISSW